MNKDIIKGKWLQIKGRVKQQWAKLTDDDLRAIEGNIDLAAGRPSSSSTPSRGSACSYR